MSELIFDSFPIKKPKTTKQGYIIAPKTRFAKAGIQSYTKNGVTTNILKRPEVLFSQKTKDSFKYAPVTIGHPYSQSRTNNPYDSEGFTFVNSRNAKKCVVGMLTDVDNDDLYLLSDVRITHQDGVDEVIRSNIRHLSASHDAKFCWIKGMYEGEPYDGEVVEMEGDHVAVVQQGRAGPEVAMIFDAIDSKPVYYFYSFFDSEDDPTKLKNNNLEIMMNEHNSKLEEITKDLQDLKSQSKEKMIDDNYKTYLEKIAELEKKIEEINNSNKAEKPTEVKEEQKDQEQKVSIDTNSPEFLALVNEAVEKRMRVKSILAKAGDFLDSKEAAGKTDAELMQAALAAQNFNIDLSKVAPEAQLEIFDSIINRAESYSDSIKNQISKTRNVYNGFNESEYIFDAKEVLSGKQK